MTSAWCDEIWGGRSAKIDDMSLVALAHEAPGRAGAGVAYTRFGCTAHYSRGNAICANALTLSENKAQRAIVAAIRAILDQPEAFAHFQAAFRRQVGARAAAGHGAAPDLARSVRDAESGSRT
jgi:hypothetical protein